MNWLLHNAPFVFVPVALGLAWMLARRRAAKPYDPVHDTPECLKGYRKATGTK